MTVHWLKCKKNNENILQFRRHYSKGKEPSNFQFSSLLGLHMDNLMLFQNTKIKSHWPWMF